MDQKHWLYGPTGLGLNSSVTPVTLTRSLHFSAPQLRHLQNTSTSLGGVNEACKALSTVPGTQHGAWSPLLLLPRLLSSELEGMGVIEGPRHNANQRVEGRQGRLLTWGNFDAHILWTLSPVGRDRGAQSLCVGHQVLRTHMANSAPQGYRPRGEDMMSIPCWGPCGREEGQEPSRAGRGGGRRGETGFRNERLQQVEGEPPMPP